MAKVVSDNMISLCYFTLNRDYLKGSAGLRRLWILFLKISHGNRVPIVVSEWEIHLHGEGEQFVSQHNKRKGA